MGDTMRNDGDEMQALSPARRIGWDLRLRSLGASRSAFARLLRCYARGECDEAVYKNLCYGLSLYLGYLKSEKEAEIEERLDALELKLKEAEK